MSQRRELTQIRRPKIQDQGFDRRGKRTDSELFLSLLGKTGIYLPYSLVPWIACVLGQTLFHAGTDPRLPQFLMRDAPYRAEGR
jgi:hypothetical protein